MFFYIFALFVIILSQYIWKWRYLFNTDFTKNFDENSPIPLLKNGIPFAIQTSEELFNFPRMIAQKYKKSVRAVQFFKESFLIVRARDAEKILSSSSKHLSKGLVYNLLQAFLRTGLITSDGEKWHTRRRLLTPAFHFNILKSFCEIFKEEADQLVIDLRQQSGKIVDMIPISAQFTLNTICESAMGIKLTSLGNNGLKYKNNIYSIGKALIYRTIKPWLHINIVYSLLGYRKELDEILEPVHEFTQTIINKRRSEFKTGQSNQESENIVDDNENVHLGSKKKRAAMMDTLLQAQSEGLIDDDGIIEETDTFTFAGHDTTATAMTFTLLLLAHNPDVQEKLYDEIQDILGGIDDPKMDDLNKLNYMDRVLKECLRIYSPVPFISRTLSEDIIHDDVLLKKGTNAQIFIFDINRDPEVFPDPEKFNPDRFLPENCADRNSFSFIPFSAGMRNCIGQRFALLELKVILAKIIQHFKILPVTKREDLRFNADLVLRTSHPIEMIFENRN